jgi:hypothetical protein
MANTQIYTCAYCKSKNRADPVRVDYAVCGVCGNRIVATYYDILEVSRSASGDDLKKSYRHLALKWHPDTNKAPQANEIFKSINEAYTILSNPAKRKEYDSTFNTTEQYTAPHVNEQEAIQLFIYEMIQFGLELALENHDWSRIEPQLIARGCPSELAKEIAINCQNYRKKIVRKRALRPFLWGLFWFALGTIITLGSYNAASPGQTYTVMWGAVLFGGISMARALYYLVTGSMPGKSQKKAASLATKKTSRIWTYLVGLATICVIGGVVVAIAYARNKVATTITAAASSSQATQASGYDNASSNDLSSASNNQSATETTSASQASPAPTDDNTSSNYASDNQSATEASSTQVTPPASKLSSLTQSEITQQMANTVEVSTGNDFVPASAPVTVSDGNGGTLTTVVGLRNPSADGHGQLVFFWHNNQFLGWNSTFETIAIVGLTSSSTGEFDVSYAHYAPSDPMSSPSLPPIMISYTWNGSTLTASGTPPVITGAQVKAK